MIGDMRYACLGIATSMTDNLRYPVNTLRYSSDRIRRERAAIASRMRAGRTGRAEWLPRERMRVYGAGMHSPRFVLYSVMALISRTCFLWLHLPLLPYLPLLFSLRADDESAHPYRAFFAADIFDVDDWERLPTQHRYVRTLYPALWLGDAEYLHTPSARRLARTPTTAAGWRWRKLRRRCGVLCRRRRRRRP